MISTMASATAAAKGGVSIAWSWHSMIHLFGLLTATGCPVAALGFGAIPRSRVPVLHPLGSQPPQRAGRAMRLKKDVKKTTPSLETLPIYPRCFMAAQFFKERPSSLKKCAEQKHFIPLGKKNQSLLQNFGNWFFWWDRCVFQTLFTSLKKRLRSKGTWSPFKKQNKRQNLGISVLFFSRKNGFRRSVETAVDV